MRLNVRKILHTPGLKLPFQFALDFTDLDFGDAFSVNEPIEVEGVVVNGADVLELMLEAETTLACVCDRCAEAFSFTKTVPYRCFLAQEKQDEENEDIVLLEDGEVDVGELARTAFILEMDTKSLCSEDCMGLCPGCGVNLNYESCTCQREVDPRLAVLAKLLDKNSDK